MMSAFRGLALSATTTLSSFPCSSISGHVSGSSLRFAAGVFRGTCGSPVSLIVYNTRWSCWVATDTVYCFSNSPFTHLAGLKIRSTRNADNPFSQDFACFHEKWFLLKASRQLYRLAMKSGSTARDALEFVTRGHQIKIFESNCDKTMIMFNLLCFLQLCASTFVMREGAGIERFFSAWNEIGPTLL